MKINKYILGLGLMMAGTAASAQGLEGIIVERYYQANAADAQYTTDQGYSIPLTSGAVTYRVYVDMAAGYKFVQMFGTPTQNLNFSTTTSFYNDENYDSQAAPTTSVLNTKKHTAMLDSWITAGGAAANKVGVMKDEDTDGSIANPHAQGILGNTLGGCFGSQIVGATGKDGMLASSGTTYTTPNVLGMSGSILDALTAGNALSSVVVNNGSIAALGGIVGPTSSNKVLVGQFTTDGTFTFAINVQLLSPTGVAQNYVHSNPTSGQLTNATLTRTAGGVPSVSIVSNDADNSICAGSSVTFTATPVNGGTPSYQWKLNGNNVGTDAATYTNSALANNDVVTVVMTAGGCDASGSATSNAITTAVISTTDYYADADGDGFGAGSATASCSNPGAGFVTNNTDCDDASASVNTSGTEVCGNGIDEDCSGADLTCTSGLTATNVTNVSTFGVGSQSSLNVDLSQGTNTVESAGVGLDMWYKFTAAQPAVRISLVGSASVSDDNDLALFDAPATSGVQLIALASENDVHPGNVGSLNADGGSEILYYTDLTVGQEYYVLVRNNNSTPGTASLRIAYIRGGAMDIAVYTNNTNNFTNNCQNFKVAYRTGAVTYTVNRLTSADVNGTPDFSYTIPSGTVAQLGRIFPANFSGASQTKYVTVDVAYSLADAFGNMNDVVVSGTTLGTFTMSSEAALQVRTSDQCPVFKSINSSLATNRGVCGVKNYNWEFTQVLPSAGLPVSVDGAVNASRIIGLSSVTGIANGQKYDVKVRAKHLDNASYTAFNTSANCVQTIGFAGMPLEQSAFTSEAVAMGGASFVAYPNPNAGSEIVLYANDFEGMLNVQILDGAGRMIQSENWTVEGNGAKTISFNESLAAGMYTVRMNNGIQTQAIKFVVVK